MNKKSLELKLSGLNNFVNPKVFLEQYGTPVHIVAEILWLGFLNGDIEGRVIADLGCGNGVFGIGALLLGAKKVYFVDVDKDILKICEKNLSKLKLKGELVNKDINLFDNKINVVFMNPPFGVQVEHADRRFLDKAMSVSEMIYSIHKIESESFIKKFGKDRGFSVLGVKKIKMRLKNTQVFHKRMGYVVNVGCFRLGLKT